MMRARGSRLCFGLSLGAALLGTRAARADEWLGSDKALHFGLSAGIAAVGYAGGALIWDSRGARIASGATLAVTAGAAKELYDLAGYGDPSWKDFTWDLIGTAVGVLAAFTVDVLVSPRASSTPQQNVHAASAVFPTAHGFVVRF